MGHASSPSLISLGLTDDFSQESAPLRWGVLASCFLHVLVLFLAFHLRFESELEQPFRAIEVALISLPTAETAAKPAPQTPSVAPPSPKVSPSPPPSPPKAQPTKEEPLAPLPTTTASERLSDSIGGAVGSIKVPSKLEVIPPPQSSSATEPLLAPQNNQTPLVEKLHLPAAPPEISRPERLTPAQHVTVPRINRSPKVKAQPLTTDTPKPLAVQPKKLEAPTTSPALKPIPEPPTLSSTSSFTRTPSKESTSIPHPEKSLESSLKDSLPSVPPSVRDSKPIKKSIPLPSQPKTPAIPKVTAPQLAQIPTTPPKELQPSPQREKLSDSMKQLLAGVKAPSLQSTPPVTSKPSNRPSLVQPSTPSTPLKSELDQQLAKLTIPDVAPVESIQQRLQHIQVQASSESGRSASKPSQGENRYLAMVEDAIDQRWVAPPLTLNNQVVILKFRIAKSGEISQVHMEQSSGNDHYDVTAFRAVQTVNPLPPFPADLQKSFIDVSYRFIKQD